MDKFIFHEKIPTILAGIMDKNFARFKISTPVVPTGPHTVIFQNKEESSCPHSYYAKTDKKRIFVNKLLIFFDLLKKGITFPLILSFLPLKKLEQKI